MAVFAVEHEGLAGLLDVGGDVVVREHHALGIAGAAARENHGGQIVEGFGWAAGDARSRSSRRAEPQQQRGDFFAEPRRGGGFLEQDGLAGDLQRDLVEQRLGGDHGFQPALLRAGGQRFARGGVVQIHRDFAREHCREIHQARPEPTAAAGCRPSPGPPTQARRRRARKIALSSTPPHFMRGRRLSPMAKRKGERCAVRIRLRCSVRMRALWWRYASVCNCCTASRTSKGVAVGRHGLAETDGDRVGNRTRHFPEEPPALEAEDAAPDAVEVHRDDRRVHALHDAFHSAAEGKHLADARDLALGKNAHDFAGADRVARLAQGPQHFARAKLGGNGNRADQFCEGLYERQVVDVFEDQEADGAVGGSDQQQRVHERHVIGHEKRAAGFGDVVAALDADAIDRMRRQPEHEAHQRIRQQDDDVDRGAQREDRRDQENARGIRVPEVDHGVLHDGLQRDSHERKQVRRRDYARLCGPAAGGAGSAR